MSKKDWSKVNKVDWLKFYKKELDFRDLVKREKLQDLRSDKQDNFIKASIHSILSGNINNLPKIKSYHNLMIERYYGDIVKSTIHSQKLPGTLNQLSKAGIHKIFNTDNTPSPKRYIDDVPLKERKETKERIIVKRDTGSDVELNRIEYEINKDRLMQRFGKNLGFGAKRFIEQYGTDWRKGLAEYAIKNKEAVGDIMYNEAKEFLEYYDQYKRNYGKANPWREDKFYLGVLYGRKKTTDEGPHKEILEQFNKIAADLGLSEDKVINALRKDLLKELRVEKRLYEFNKEYWSAEISRLGQEFLSKFEDKHSEKKKKLVKKRKKLLTAQYDGVDLPYAVAKGPEEMSYVELLEYIRNSPQVLIHPSNLWALKKSSRFKKELYDHLIAVGWTEAKVDDWWEQNIVQEKSTYTLLDPTKRAEIEKKRASYRKLVTAGTPTKKNNRLKSAEKKSKKKK